MATVRNSGSWFFKCSLGSFIRGFFWKNLAILFLTISFFAMSVQSGPGEWITNTLWGKGGPSQFKKDLEFMIEDWSHMRKLPKLFDEDVKNRIKNFNIIIKDYKDNRLSEISKKNQEAFNNILKPHLNFMVQFVGGKHPGKAEEILNNLKTFYDALE